MAVGAQVAHPGRQVVSLSGDGGPAMLLGELLTVNISSLGMVRLEMMVASDPPFETDHAQVDFAAIAVGAGFFTWRGNQTRRAARRRAGRFRPRRSRAA